jgi:hypothetical protein
LRRDTEARVGDWYLGWAPLTLPHYYDFGRERASVGTELSTPAAWDALRETDGVFGLPSERSAWEASACRPELERRARRIVAVLDGLGARRVCSYGVGGATLELNLVHAAPQIELVCTEAAPRTAERLRALLFEAEVVRHDLRHDPPLAADAHLLHRIDTEFSNAEWPEILGRFRQPVVVVATGVLGWAEVREELALRRSGSATRAGWARSRRSLERLWGGSHTAEPIDVGDLPAYLLRPRA